MESQNIIADKLQEVNGLSPELSYHRSGFSRSPSKWKTNNENKKKLQRMASLLKDNKLKMNPSGEDKKKKDFDLNIEQQEPDVQIKKAARHLRDAIYHRSVRHDLDFYNKKLFQITYEWQTNPSWQSYLFMTAWFYMLSVFFESNNSFDMPILWSKMFTILFVSEQCFNIGNLVDIFLESIHLYSYICYVIRDTESFKAKVQKALMALFEKKKLLTTRFMIDFAIFVDFIMFYTVYPKQAYHYTAILRGLKVFYYSKMLRRTILAFVRSIPQVIDIFLLFFGITCLYAALGQKVFESVTVSDELIKGHKSPKSFGDMSVMLYILITFDNWPEIAKPYQVQNYWYLAYFQPFVMFNLLIFYPIPIAVIFDGFRKRRGDLVQEDRIKEKNALYYCFYCQDLDHDNLINYNEWESLIYKVYGPRMKKQNIEALYKIICTNLKTNMKMEEFTTVGEIIKQNKELLILESYELPIWKIIKDFMNMKLKLKTIIDHPWFDIFMFFVVIINSVILIMIMLEPDEQTEAIATQIDQYLVYIYLVEFVVKIFALGPVDYWKDNWNKFDFIQLILSMSTDIAMSFIRVARNAKSAKGAKILKVEFFT